VHILKILADMEAVGLLSWNRETREVELRPRLVAAVNRMFSLLFLLFGYYFSQLLDPRSLTQETPAGQ